VLIDASDGRELWGAIGVDENVIAASWQALVDSLEYAEQPGRRMRRPAPDGAGARSA
jgi:2-isopropylmalate synthase